MTPYGIVNNLIVRLSGIIELATPYRIVSYIFLTKPAATQFTQLRRCETVKLGTEPELDPDTDPVPARIIRINSYAAIIHFEVVVP